MALALGLAALGLVCLWNARDADRALGDSDPANRWRTSMLWPFRVIGAVLLLTAVGAAIAAGT